MERKRSPHATPVFIAVAAIELSYLKHKDQNKDQGFVVTREVGKS